MTDPHDGWNDDRLGTLLRETFAAHESMADPDRAVQLSRESLTTTTGSRRRWLAPVAAAAVLVLGASGVTALLQHDDHSGSSANHPSGGPSSRTPSAGVSTGVPHDFAANHAAADRESERVAELVPLPTGATQLPGEPADWVANGLTLPGDFDSSLTHTTWWSVPASQGSVRSYLLAHDPPDSTRKSDVDDTSTGRGVITYDLTYLQRSAAEPNAYLAVQLIVAWQRHGTETLVRADAYTAAREARNDPRTFVRDGVTSVRVLLAPGAAPGKPVGSPTEVTLDGPAAAELVDTLNGLRGSARTTSVSSCPMIAGARSETVTVTKSDGTVLGFALTPACFGQVRVSIDGHDAKPTLDPANLDDVVRELTR